MQLTGSVRLEVDGKPPLVLNAGDFVLIPAASGFTMSSIDRPAPSGLRTRPLPGEGGVFRIGQPDGPVEVQQLIGHCSFGSPDADLLVSLLPDIVVVGGDDRLAALADLVREEARADRPAGDVVLEHLLQVLLIEAFRSTPRSGATSGLLRGLVAARIGPALRAVHAAPHQPWTVAEMARTAGLSRSAFFTRFNRIVGEPPISYLLNWRMTLAKHMLRSGRHDIAVVSSKVGYGSTSAFSTAFARHVGYSPSRYMKVASAG